MTRLTGIRTTGQFISDGAGHLYGIQLPSEGQEDGAVLRINGGAEDVDGADCGPLGSGQACEHVFGGSSLVSSIAIHRGAWVFMFSGGVIRRSARFC